MDDIYTIGNKLLHALKKVTTHHQLWCTWEYSGDVIEIGAYSYV